MADAQDVRRWVASAVALTRLPAVGSEVYYFAQGHADQWDLPAPEAAQAMLACTVASVEFFPSGDEPYARVSLVPAEHLNAVADTRPDAESFMYFRKLLVQADIQRSYLAVPKVCAEYLLPRFEQGSTRQQMVMSDVSGELFAFEYKLNGPKHELSGGWGGLIRHKDLHVDDSVLFVRRSSDRHLFLEGRRRQPPVQHGAQDPVAELALAAQGGHFTVSYYPGRGGDLFVVPRGAVEEAMGKQWEAGMDVSMRAKDQVHAAGGQGAQFEPVTGWIDAVIQNTVWHNLMVTIDASGVSTAKNMWDVEAMRAQPPAAKRARTVTVVEAASTSKEPATAVKLFGAVIGVAGHTN